MQRRLVALAPLFVAALLLHVVLACRPATAAPVGAGTVPVGTPAPAVSTGPDGARGGGTPTGMRSVRVVLQSRVDGTTLTQRGGWSRYRTAVAGCAGKACGSVTRSGRSCQSTDRRDQATQQAPVPPDVAPRRDDTVDRRPRTVGAALDHIFLSVLRC